MFDYRAPAELFYPLRPGKWAPIGFRSFGSSAEAIKFAIEQLTPRNLQGAILEIDEERFGGLRIRQLYDNQAFPLDRSAQ